MHVDTWYMYTRTVHDMYSMYVCICMYMYVCMYVCEASCMWSFMYVCLYMICIYFTHFKRCVRLIVLYNSTVCICTYTCTHIYTTCSTCVATCTLVHMYVCTYTHVHHMYCTVHIHVCIAPRHDVIMYSVVWWTKIKIKLLFWHLNTLWNYLCTVFNVLYLPFSYFLPFWPSSFDSFQHSTCAWALLVSLVLFL